MSLEIAQEQFGEVKVLVLTGRLDTETAPEFEVIATESVEAGARTFVIDLTAIGYVSSAGLRVLLALGKKLDRDGGLKLCGLRGVVREVFDKSGFARLFQIYPTRESALGGAAAPKEVAEVTHAAARLLGAEGNAAATGMGDEAAATAAAQLLAAAEARAQEDAQRQRSWWQRLLAALGLGRRG